ncbi:cyclophilin-like fold protein [Clostridium sp.]|uniref:cyclophilin-like fold protein n=1 Tax=Clostridium sp. TaxID=1506 RepID=UPI00359FE74C
MKKKKVEIIAFVVIIILLIAGCLYLFTPIGFLNLSLEGEYQVKITVNGHEMTATMENSKSSMAFKKILSKGPKKISMRDYSNMEKIGKLWKGLPRKDEKITTQPGDIILYIGSALVVYYNNNSWNFTKLGHINDVTQAELKEILGNGNVTMTFELIDSESKKTTDFGKSTEKVIEEKTSMDESSQKNTSIREEKYNEEKTELKLTISNTTLTATLANNSSAEALVELLKTGPLTINMDDYASMEKVGSLGMSLPRNDEQITTKAGDLILYQGSAFVIYYEPNSWNFTKLGKINNVTAKELKEILGSGSVSVTLSIE